MATGFSAPKGKIRRGVNSDENVGATWKSPLKLFSPIVDTKTIYLHDWWLVRPRGGEGIAVGGFTIRREGVETSFCSSSIKKRHDNCTIESSDGFIIFISGLINRSITQQNGFSLEVCSHFLNGFPCNWDDFASQCVREESTVVGSHSRLSDESHTFLLGSLQDMSFLQIRDLLLSTHGFYEEDALKEHISSNLLETLKLGLGFSSINNSTHDSDLPKSDKSNELQDTSGSKRPRLNLNRVRTRSMTKMENAASRAKMDLAPNTCEEGVASNAQFHVNATHDRLSNRRKANVTFKQGFKI